MSDAPKRSIQGKLRGLVVVAVGTAILIVAAAGLWQETARYAESKREALLGAASAFAAASSEAVAARDGAAMIRAIRGIGRLRGVPYAAVEAPDGTVLAELGTGVRLTDDVDLTQDGAVDPLALVFSRTVAVTVPVVNGGETVGRLVIVSQTDDLADRLLSVLATAAVAAAVALAAGLLISLRLQGSITRPLVALAGAMAAIRQSHDYDTAIAIRSDDEVGVLAQNFSAMMGEVRDRDRRLADHRDRLEQDVADRTEDFRHAKEDAEAANAAKSDFLATMSHEIRTPMNGMLVMAELLAGADLPSRQRRYAEVIARSGQSLLAIINDILDFSKIESGKLTVEQIPFGPHDVVDTVVTLFAERARQKGLDLAAYVSPEVPSGMVGDPVRVTQVLSNLVNNALKFAETGHVAIRVEPEAGGTIRFGVTDTGIGIAEDKLGTIFEAFSQADGTTARRFGGTGLGLAICKRLVEAMGGEIRVLSREGEGSDFSFGLAGEGVGTEVAPAAPVRVEVVLAGEATRGSVVRSLEASGLLLPAPPSPEERADSGEARAGRGATDLVTDADTLLRAGVRPVTGRIVAVAPMGDAAGAEAIARGLADILIRRPIVQSEWREVLARLVSGAAFEPPHRADERRKPEARQDRFAGARVLVVDDSPVNLEVACEALSRLGVAALTCQGGREAIARVGSEPWDVVLMDGSMPDVDGYQATRAIRQAEAEAGRRRTPIVALTAHVVGPAADAWRAAGMDEVLHKPFTVARLEACLAAILSTEGSGPNPAADGLVMAPPPTAAGPHDGEDPLLDEDTITALENMAAGGSRNFIGHVLSLFRRDGPEAISAMRDAAAAADAREMASAAHRLKSMSLNVGGSRLAALLAGIEAAAAERDVLPRSEGLAQVEALFDETSVALSGRLDRETAGMSEAAA